MKTRRAVAFVVLLLIPLGVRHAIAQTASGDAKEYAAGDAQILKEIHEHSEAMENLEHLSDAIGPRVTGSAQLKQANEWTAEMFRKYGLTNVHLEPWTIAHSWTRGAARGRILKPTEHPLTIAAAGWSPSTPGVVRGSGGVFRCQEKRRVREISRKAERRGGDLPGARQLVAAQTRGFQKRSCSRDAGAAADEGRTAGAAAVCGSAGNGESANRVFQTGGRGRGAARFK